MASAVQGNRMKRKRENVDKEITKSNSDDIALNEHVDDEKVNATGYGFYVLY